MTTWAGNPDWKYIEDADDGARYVLPDSNWDGDGDNIEVAFSDRWGGVDGLWIGGYLLKWEDVDRLKEVIRLAEERWRSNHEDDNV